MKDESMTVKQAIELLRSLPVESQDYELKIWLPGSKLWLTGKPFARAELREAYIEGNVEEGSALS